METFSALLAICAGNSPVPGEFPTQRPATRSFDVFFDLHLIKRSSKHSRGWWFETLSPPLWRHRYDNRITPKLDFAQCDWKLPWNVRFSITGSTRRECHELNCCQRYINAPWIIRWVGVYQNIFVYYIMYQKFCTWFPLVLSLWFGICRPYPYPSGLLTSNVAYGVIDRDHD